nr:AGE family epimerase/isomerase [uncultured Niameybacter sp.]
MKVLIEQIKENLLQGITPFWKSLIDNENGGYYGYVDFDLNTQKNAIKGVILNSRILWFFANKYTLLRQKEDLEYARHAYNFLKDKCWDKQNGGVYWALNADGTVQEGMKHIYNQAFAIYALSSYYEASKDEEALERALILFKLIENKGRDTYGYMEAFTEEWAPISNEKLSDNKKLCEDGVVAEKTMNTLLHILEAYTELYRVSGNKIVEKSLREILDSIRIHVYDSKEHILGVFFDKQLNNICNMHSYGHDIEAAWLLDRAAEVLKDEEVRQMTYAYTKEIAYKTLEVAFDGQAMNNERFKDEVDTTRVWWVQAESIVGFINAYEKTGDKVFLETVQKLWEFIRVYFIDPRSGEWYWDLDSTNQPVSKKPIVEPWKCPYHNGRMCFEVIRRQVNV